MKNHTAPNNALLQSITPATKARVLESIYPNGQICYADEITHKLTRIKRVLGGLSNLARLPQLNLDFANFRPFRLSNPLKSLA